MLELDEEREVSGNSTFLTQHEAGEVFESIYHFVEESESLSIASQPTDHFEVYFNSTEDRISGQVRIFKHDDNTKLVEFVKGIGSDPFAWNKIIKEIMVDCWEFNLDAE